MHLAVQGRRIHIYGSATDPDTSGPVSVHYVVGGRLVGIQQANLGGHGYSRWIVRPYGYGAFPIKVQAVNVGLGTHSTTLGVRTVARINPATRNPRAVAAYARSGLSLRAFGIAHDPDQGRAGVVVRVFNNSRAVAVGRADARTGRFSFRTRLHYGTNHMWVVAYNVGVGSRSAVTGRATFVVPPPRPVYSNSYSGNQAVAASLLASYGWSQSEMGALIKLWNRESSWNVYATNPSSGAYGIPQALPGGKMASAGGDWRSNARTQIRWGLGYIKGRFGSPSNAWAHEVSQGWY